MKYSDLKVGMLVQFMSYEEISNEYRNDRGEEHVCAGFPYEMSFLCGRYGTVESFDHWSYGDDDYDIAEVILDVDSDISDELSCYTITSDMLCIPNTHIDDEPPELEEVPDLGILFGGK